jgi:hypothetical protein
VRLVDSEQCHACLFEQALEARREQAFRRHIQQFQLPGYEIAFDLHRRCTVEAGVEERRRDAELLQRRDLVLHQRDQRRHHHRAALAQQRRDLVAQRLAAAGRHQHQRVAARHDGVDDGRLLAAKRGVAEDAIEQA